MKNNPATPADESSALLSRRRAFGLAGSVGALAGVAALLPVAPSAPVAAPEPKPAPEKGGGYQLSEHVQRYYKTARV